MFGFGGKKHKEISAAELNAMLKDDAVLLVDVREVDEFSDGHIAGAINMPLSQFQASRIPDPDGKTVVLQCAGGKRAAMALDKCASAQASIETHLAGGIGAWKSAGFPIVRG